MVRLTARPQSHSALGPEQKEAQRGAGPTHEGQTWVREWTTNTPAIDNKHNVVTGEAGG